MNLIVEEAIKFHKKIGQVRIAALIELAYNLGFTEGQYREVPQGLKDAYYSEENYL